MNQEPLFYLCKSCKNIVEKIKNSGRPLVCCGQEMKLLTANTEDAAGEKHVPVLTIKDTVAEVIVGEVEHPMLEKHYIQWIYLQTTNGIQRKDLEPFQKPSASFSLLPEEKVIAAYEYCNLHGLWKVDG